MTEPAKRVLQLHEERVAVYRRLEEAFRSYLLDEQEMIFGMAVQSCTADFARISREVMAAGAEGSEELRGAVGRLQKVEQAKLAATARLQVLQKSHYIDAARKDREEEAIAVAERQGSNILCPHDHGRKHDAVPLTLADKRIPSFDEQYNRAASESARVVAECIADINECVEEVRELLGEY